MSMTHRIWRKFDRQQILKLKDPWAVAENAFEIALELAVLGYVDKATELYTLYEDYAQDSTTIWNPGLYFAWEATGLWPDSIPAEDRTPEALSKMETERILWKRSTNESDEGLDNLISAATGFGRLDEDGDPIINAGDLTAAIDLALFMDKREKALDILQIFADNFHTTWAEIGKSRQAWRYLKHHALGQAIEVKEAKVEAFYKEAYSTFKARLENGQTREFRDLSMKELVKVFNDNTLKNAVWEEMDIDPDDPPETILHDPATDEQIKELEDRLGRTLPDDYKEFFAATNGIDSFWNGFYGEPRFLGAEDVHLFDASEQQKAWSAAAVRIRFVTDMSIKVKWPPLDRVIAINDGDENTRFVWLIEPEQSVIKLGDPFFAVFTQLPSNEKERVQKLLDYFHAGISSSAQLGWQVCTWCPSTLEILFWTSLREYLEHVAGDTASEDILDEADEQGRLLHSHDIFAFQMR